MKPRETVWPRRQTGPTAGVGLYCKPNIHARRGRSNLPQHKSLQETKGTSTDAREQRTSVTGAVFCDEEPPESSAPALTRPAAAQPAQPSTEDAFANLQDRHDGLVGDAALGGQCPAAHRRSRRGGARIEVSRPGGRASRGAGNGRRGVVVAGAKVVTLASVYAPNASQRWPWRRSTFLEAAQHADVIAGDFNAEAPMWSPRPRPTEQTGAWWRRGKTIEEWSVARALGAQSCATRTWERASQA